MKRPILLLLFPILELNASTIDICDRGIIGELIAERIGTSFSVKKIFSPPCSKVNKKKMSRLEFLDLSNHDIEVIPENAFVGLDSLLTLNLSKNQISTIEKNAFIGLESLKLLFLDRNQISILQENTFIGLDTLELLFLQNNQISTIEENAFVGLESLKKLLLDDYLTEDFDSSFI